MAKIDIYLTKVRNELTALSKQLSEDFTNYSEPQIKEYLQNACSELDGAIMCCLEDK